MLCGAQAEREELLFILADSGSTALVVEDRKKNCEIASTLPIHLVVLLSDEEPETDETLKVLNLATLMAKPASTAGKSEPGYTGDFDIHVWNLWQTQRRDAQSWQLVTPNHYWCSIWCSAAAARRSLPQCPPSWHAYERTCEYFILSQVVRKFIPISATSSGTCRNSNPRLWLAFPGCGNQFMKGAKQFRATD